MGRGHLTRAIIEGVCFAMRDSLEIMRQQGGLPSEVRAIGGGRAQVGFGCKHSPMCSGFPSPRRSPPPAPHTAVGIGMFGSVDDAAQTCIKSGASIEPNQALVARYDEMYSAYRQLYPALRDNFTALAGIVAGQRQ